MLSGFSFITKSLLKTSNQFITKKQLDLTQINISKKLQK